MISCIKGVVLKKLKGIVEIKLETGEHFWITPTPQLKLKTRVLVGWDWTHSQPTFIKTKFEDTEIEEPDEDIIIDTTPNYGVIDETFNEVFSMTERSTVFEDNDVNDV